jgi:hypothetical protein
MRKETRKDLVLLIITSIASAIGMTSVFLACRPLAWIAILVSDSYLFLVLHRGRQRGLDALYISFFTLAFTDFSPKPGYGQFVVIGQLVSGGLYLFGAFPLLISRIATFRGS